MLNDQYTFDNFVVGPCNRFAHAAAMGASESPGTYNPFFLHGSVGLGKTHLLQSICFSILDGWPESRILYLSCETFVNHFIAALENGNLLGVPAQVPQRRRAGRGRHPPAGEQGAHAGGVLPYLQHALQRGQADRAVLGQSADRHPDPAGATHLTLQVGHGHRDREAVLRDAHGDRQAQEPRPRARDSERSRQS